ncbi:hypothetical protein ACIB24_02720 [Spongisporangium articulatum]|uniref:Uncharacterized protein n=1 Tax=Spongisporangium articulatum TaxID=3362603 RepID=A0ABW8AHY1_9ACTN
MSTRGTPTTVQDAQAVVEMRWLAWIGVGIAAICLVLALSSWQLGRHNDNALVAYVAAPFFVLLAAAWIMGVRRLRARVAEARKVLEKRR